MPLVASCIVQELEGLHLKVHQLKKKDNVVSQNWPGYHGYHTCRIRLALQHASSAKRSESLSLKQQRLQQKS